MNWVQPFRRGVALHAALGYDAADGTTRIACLDVGVHPVTARSEPRRVCARCLLRLRVMARRSEAPRRRLRQWPGEEPERVELGPAPLFEGGGGAPARRGGA